MGDVLGQPGGLTRAAFEAAVLAAATNPTSGGNWDSFRALCRDNGFESNGATCKKGADLHNRAIQVFRRFGDQLSGPFHYAEVGAYVLTPEMQHPFTDEVAAAPEHSRVVRALRDNRPPVPAWVGTAEVVVFALVGAPVAELQPLCIVKWKGAEGGLGSAFLRHAYADLPTTSFGFRHGMRPRRTGRAISHPTYGEIEEAVLQGLARPSTDATKWDPLKSLLNSHGAFSSIAALGDWGPLNMRVEQLLKPTAVIGTVEPDAFAQVSVLILTGDAAQHHAASREMAEESIRKQYLTKRPPVPTASCFESLLVLRQEENESVVPVMLVSGGDGYATQVIENSLPPEDEGVGVSRTRFQADDAMRAQRIRVPADPPGLVGVAGAYADAITALRGGKHVMLVGPPGTGKTELAAYICEALSAASDDAVATADWTSATVMGGYVLKQEGSDQVLDFQAGLATEAMASGRWLIVDEFNRADMDKAFGELFNVLLGKRVRLPFFKRSGTDQIPVYVGGPNPGDAHHVPCPESWRMIGAMNTFDRFSLSRLSLALMRRFATVHVELPSPKQYATILEAAENAAANDARLDARARTELSIVRETLCRLFADEDAGTLRGAGAAIGPAIPRDILRFAAEHLAMGPGRAAELVARGCKMMLFPQYEGRQEKHNVILAAVVAVLGAEVAEEAKLGAALAVYTGHDT